MKQLTSDLDQFSGDRCELSCSTRHCHSGDPMINISPILYRPAAWLTALILACSFALSACNSSSNDAAPLDDDPVPGSAAEPTLTFHSVKTFRFSWSDVSDATDYKLLENPDGVSGFNR